MVLRLEHQRGGFQSRIRSLNARYNGCELVTRLGERYDPGVFHFVSVFSVVSGLDQHDSRSDANLTGIKVLSATWLCG